MATDQSPLDLHSRNYKLSLGAPAVDETKKIIFAAISIQTTQQTNKNNIPLCMPDIPSICSFKTHFLESPLNQGIRLFL